MSESIPQAQKNLADIIRERAPITSSELVKICQQKFDWKKSTTYTMLKRLEIRGIFSNDGGVINSILSKEEWEANESNRFVEENFQDPLPRFLTAFTRGRKLSQTELAKLKKLIEEQEG